jgi:hypothetical protein
MFKTKVCLNCDNDAKGNVLTPVSGYRQRFYRILLPGKGFEKRRLCHILRVLLVLGGVPLVKFDL